MLAPAARLIIFSEANLSRNTADVILCTDASETAGAAAKRLKRKKKRPKSRARLAQHATVLPAGAPGRS